jgi:hypothetical protein
MRGGCIEVAIKHAAQEEELELAVGWWAVTPNTHRELEKRYGT